MKNRMINYPGTGSRKYKMKFPVFLVFLFLLSNTGCQKMKQADLILHHGKVYTVDPVFSIKEAIAIKDRKILAMGTNEEILKNYEATQKKNLEGKPVYPGFIDAHCHFYSYGLGLGDADLTGTRSFSEVLSKIQKHREQHPDTEWITGRGWDHNDWKVKEYPTKEKLDSLFPNTPVFLTRIDGHAGLANREALNRAGISASTSVEGGAVLTKNGEPTGILIDNAMSLIGKQIPEPSREQSIRALKDAQRNCFSVGLTTVDDAGLDKKIIDLIRKGYQDNWLKIRLYVMVNPTGENKKAFINKGALKTAHLTVSSVKLYADGALGSRGACLLEPYSDRPEQQGFLLHPPEYFRKWARIAKENNFQVNTHAIGDSANRTILNIYGEFLEKGNDRRWRVEHAQTVHPKDQSKFARFGILPSVQPTHATSDMYWADERLGEKRLKYAYPYKDLLDQAGVLPAGSDFPVEDINPLYGFYAAVTRKDLEGSPDEGFQTENALSRKEALRAMTYWAAYANFEDRQKGTLEPWKLADLVVLEKDIMKVPLSGIPEVKVLETYIGGKCVYNR